MITAQRAILYCPSNITTQAANLIQVHTHSVAANLTYHGAEGRWKALQVSDIYE